MTIWQDVRFGARSLAKHPGVTAVSVIVLALGIGANTALFTVANAVLLRPVAGVADPDGLVRLVRLQNSQPFTNWSYPDYVDYRDQTSSFGGLVAERVVPISYSHGITERIPGAVVTENYFAVLGVRAALGRLFTSDDDRAPGAHPVGVISHRFWTRDFGRDLAAVGQKLILNGYAFQIVGVAAPEFQGMNIGEQTDVWVPMMMQREAMPRNAGSNFLASRSAGWLTIYGRLRPDVSLLRAQTELETIARRLEQAYPETNTGRSAKVTRDVGLSPSQRADLRGLLGLLMAGVALLLLIACENVANLFLTRAADRLREIAIRLAVGASRWRLIRQLLTESLMLCLAATGLGLLLVPVTIDRALKLLGPADIAFQAPATIDLRVLLFALGVTLVTGVLFGLAPALQAAKTEIVGSLKASTSGSLEWRMGRTPRLATMLLLGQVAICAVLLVGAGLLVRSMVRILDIQPGFQSNHVLLAAVDLAIRGYSEAQGKQFTEQLVRRLEALPEVDSVSLSKSEPARDWSDRRPVFYPEQEPSPDELRRNPDIGLLVDANRITPGYFRTLGIALVAGRDFSWRDREETTSVAIVSQTLAQRLWPGENAVGRRISAPDANGPHRQPLGIVGVASDAKYRSILTRPPLLLYEPQMQRYDSYLSIAVRTKGDPAAFAPRLRREAAALDGNLPLYNVRTFSEQVDRSLWQQRSAAALIGIFGLIALALATLGLYSQLEHSVSKRMREIGIRMALGADARTVARSVVCRGASLAAAGAIVGLLIAAGLTPLAESRLYGVSAQDPLTFGVAWIVLMLVATAASYFPARAATRVDPMQALRVD